MKKETTTVVSPIVGEITSDKTLGINDKDIIEAEVIEEEEWCDNHPNFIESNTQAITLEELTTKNIIPTFCDNTLTISHQNFIGSVIGGSQESIWRTNNTRAKSITSYHWKNTIGSA